MPRTSRSHAADTSAAPAHSRLNRAIAYHASQITILWIVVVFMSFATYLVLLSYMTRLDNAEYALALADQRLTALEGKLQDVAMGSGMPVATATHSEPATTLTGSQPTSPSGALNRGSLSPDGTKYAGYNDTVKGKIGMAVEIVATGKVKYIEILNTKVESTGSGTASESQMSVRWVDNSTIEYDVLVTKADGSQVKETRTSQIYF